MGVRLFVFAILLFLVTIPNGVVGQKVRFYNSEQGLPNSLIHRVYQDNLGYIWTATENGASYFDGVRFTTFRHDRNKPGSIASDLVKVIYTDSKGNTWVGTADGLQIFDRENNLFRDFQLQCPDFTQTPYITSIVESSDNKYLLVSVSGYGIIAYNMATYQIDEKLTQQLKELYNNNFLGILFVDSQGSIWSFAEQGSFFKLNFQNKRLEPIQWKPELIDLSRKIIVSTIAEDPLTHNILIGTFNHGIFIFDNATKKIRNLKGIASAKYRIRVILPERKDDGNNNPVIWVGTEDSGLKKFDRFNEEVSSPDFQYAPIDLENCKVHSIMQDAQGNIWAAIFQKGLLLVPKLSNNFDYIKLSEVKGSTSVNIACATSITRDNSNNLWVGTDGGGLFKIADNGARTRYTHENTPLPNNAIMTLTADKQGTLWISTYMGGITTFNPQRGFQNFSTETQLQKVNCSVYDSKNNCLYFGTLGHGVKRLSLSTNELITFPNPNVQGWVSSICIDAKGILWVGQTGGLRCFSTVTGEEVNLDWAEKLKGITLNTSLVGKDGNYWIGSPRGLYHLNDKTREITLYAKTDGLPGNSICAIQEDEKGQLWITTMNGLSLFNPNTKVFKNFYVHDGLQDNEFRSKASFKDQDGKMYFGGINGISSFYPRTIVGEEKPLSKLYFSRLTVLNRNVDYDEALGKKNILDKHISRAKQITLKKNQNVFSLEFSVLEYANPQKVVYGYLLEGFDKEWRFTGSNLRLATYTNLPEGSYVFKVKAFFEGNTDEKNITYNEINIRILPPWYKSWWAYLIYLSISMLMVWELLNLQIRRKIRISERLEFEKKEMKLQMFTDLTHEIRTPFTLVMTPLKSMRDSETDLKRKEMFNLMYRNVLRVLRSLNQLMDIRKIDNHQLKLNYRKTDLIFFIHDLMKSFEQLAIMRNIDFRLVSGFESLDVWIDQVNFDKALFNILSNAFKFTPDNGYIMISLDTIKNSPGSGLRQSVKEYIELCVENSGSKIDIQEIDKIFDRFYQSSNNKMGGGSGVGLHLAKMIVELHHGRILARNTERGVAFVAQIPAGFKHLSSVEIAELQKDSLPDVVGHDEEIALENTSYVEIPQADDENLLQKGNKSKRNIVFVDDDADLCTYIRMELSEKYHVEAFTEGHEAWKVISTTLPDAVITDLLMPDIDGIALCRKIKQNPETNHLPVIILTSQTDEECEQQCIDSGADHFLTKPVSLELLKSTISQAIQTREMMRNKYKANLNPNFDEITMSSPDNRLIAKVIETIRRNIENPEFNVDDLSREVGVSRVHLNRKLKENINISPNVLIKSVRLKQAAYLLINNKVNISEVAYKVGFSSHPYFSSNFKEYFGMSPTEFVSKYAESDEKESLNKLFEN